MAHQISNAKEKVSYYRKAADEAGRNARAATDPDMQMAYLGIQRTWVYLADELEREIALANSGVLTIDEPDDVLIPEAVRSPVHRSR